MKMHPGRMLGIVMGFVILATIFLIPLVSSYPGASSGKSNTLYGIVGPLLSNPGSVQQSSSNTTLAADYVLIIAFILLVIAGLVGIFPLGTGVLGAVGMAMITVGSYLIFPNGGAPSYAAGFYVIWAASIISLGASFWHARRKTETTTASSQQPSVTMQQPGNSQ